MDDLLRFLDTRLPAMPQAASAEEWLRTASQLREEILQRVVFKGEAAAWRHAPTRVEWQDTRPGGRGYCLKALRFEALPGLWVPAILYEPQGLGGEVPATLNLNGHEYEKDAAFQQARCINLAKRGMLALNVEWFGCSQLGGAGYAHNRLNQLDLCGASGLAPFFLAAQRAFDLLLLHPHADAKRVAVSGLSGGGWQAILLGALDTRVSLVHSVAGYGSFSTRLRTPFDLGDAEQLPCDMATVADYTHLTALMAPRPLLLTHNANDECCFLPDTTPAILIETAAPVYELFGRRDALRLHISRDPGTHSYDVETRQAFYALLTKSFYGLEAAPSDVEIDCAEEMLTPEALAVSMPVQNEDFNTLALKLSVSLPVRHHDARFECSPDELSKRRDTLRSNVRATHYGVHATPGLAMHSGDVTAVQWTLSMDGTWHVPVSELARPGSESTIILMQDGGRADCDEATRTLLQQNRRVIVVDPLFIGESGLRNHNTRFALMVGAAGERPIGLQASQIAAVARWARVSHGPVELVATGRRSSLIALVAATLEGEAIGGVELRGSLSSLKEIIIENLSADDAPEMFCFGLLEAFDIPDLTALVAPRPVRYIDS